MTDKAFLTWLLNRLIHVYGESENLDFVLRLRRIVDSMSDDPPAPDPSKDREILTQEERRGRILQWAKDHDVPIR